MKAGNERKGGGEKNQRELRKLRGRRGEEGRAGGRQCLKRE